MSFSYIYRHRVRYRECDPMGVVYHTHYVDYFEAARTEALRELGLAYKDLEASGIQMPVIEVGVKYKKPAYYDDLLEIHARIEDPPRVRIRIDYDVYKSGEKDVLVNGHVSLCFIDVDRDRPVVAPPMVVHLFDKIFTSQN